MNFEQCFAKEWKSISDATAVDSEKASLGFDCNICLDFAHDPVVTLCGHLYCWSCIYKWFYYQSASLASDEHPQCPVCKADVSHTTVVPLYGRGQTPSGAEPEGKAPSQGVTIPPRPPALGTEILMSPSSHGQQLQYRNPYQDPHFAPQAYSDYEEESLGTTRDPLNSAVGMFGEMVYSRVFGNSQSLFTYANSYHQVLSSNPRLRRQMVQADKSLSRISLFLFCCFFICLILF